MFMLSGFADEISADLTTQLDVLGELGIKHLELRGVWGKNVLQLDDDEAETVKSEMDKRDMKVSAIGSPIGKIGIDAPFEPHLEAFRRAMELAERLECKYIRMFSFFVPEGQADSYRPQVMERLSALVAEAQGHPITLLHENERRIYGDVPRRCLDILETLASPQLRMEDRARLIVIGGGLAGSEAAWQAALRGVDVLLYEMRPGVTTPAHTTGLLAELVCSNSLGSNRPERAPGLLKRELRSLGSIILRCADACPRARCRHRHSAE